MPTLWGQTGIFYFCAALALGGAFWFFGWRLASRLGEIDARRLLLASIVYLPLLLAAMAIDKI
jgi:heme O synthase-like polyprenyltransferase